MEQTGWTTAPRAPDTVFDAPRILILADNEELAKNARRAAESLGARVGDTIALADACERLDLQSRFDGLIVEMTIDHGPLTDTLLARVVHLASRDRVAALVCCPFGLVDRVEAQLAGSSVTLLIDPDETERVAALAVASQDRPLAYNDSSREFDTIRLRRLADEVGRIARSLSSLSAQAPARSQGYASGLLAELNDTKSGFSAEPVSLTSTPPPVADAVRKVIRMRRMRASFFDPALFADPAWDMLLDLFAARIEGDDVAVSSLCIAAAVPPTTALRWIKTMSDHGLLERHADPSDGRRIYVRLSEATARAMAGYFQSLQRFEGVAI